MRELPHPVFISNMFGAIKDMAKRIERINENAIINSILRDPILQAQIIDLNQKQLYDQGLQADGTPTGNYSPVTISKWKPLAAAEGRDGRSDHITGKDTGETYESMKVVINSTTSFKIFADDRNNFEAQEPNFLGLTIESIDEIIPEIRDEIIAKVKKGIAS